MDNILDWVLSTATAVVGGLVGLVWADSGRRIKKLEESKIDSAVCQLKHESLLSEMREIKETQRVMMTSLDGIRLQMARQNGFQEGQKND